MNGEKESLPLTPTLGAGTGGVHVNQASGTISFIGLPPPNPLTYSINFGETGLANGTEWSVSLNGTVQSRTTSTISFTVPNGSYDFSIAPLAGFNSTPSSGQLTVSNASLSILVSFGQTYLVSITPFGLAINIGWGAVLMDGLRTWSGLTGKVTLILPNGTYQFDPIANDSTYRGIPGSFRVDGGSLTVVADFDRVNFAVYVHESGLPPGGGWWISPKSGVVDSTSAANQTLELPNGTYYYSAGSANASRRCAPSSFIVAGLPVSLDLRFAPVWFSFIFREQGLPRSTVWSVTLNGTTERGMGPLTFSQLVNGTYHFSVGAVNGFLASPSEGLIAVSPSENITTISFDPAAMNRGSGEQGPLPVPLVIGAGIVVAAGIAVLSMYRRVRMRGD